MGLRIHPQGTASENRRKTSFCFFHKPVSPFASRLQTKDYHTGIAFAANVGLWKRRRISPAGFKDGQLRVAGRISVVSWVPCHETPSPRLRATRISVPREKRVKTELPSTCSIGKLACAKKTRASNLHLRLESRGR